MLCCKKSHDPNENFPLLIITFLNVNNIKATTFGNCSLIKRQKINPDAVVCRHFQTFLKEEDFHFCRRFQEICSNDCYYVLYFCPLFAAGFLVSLLLVGCIAQNICLQMCLRRIIDKYQFNVDGCMSKCGRYDSICMEDCQNVALDEAREGMVPNPQQYCHQLCKI